MLQVKSLEKVLAEKPDFKRGWTGDGMANPKFGSVTPVVVCKETGEPIYDQYVIEEVPGSIIIPYDACTRAIRVGLITSERHVPGKVVIEAPRGFGEKGETPLQTAYRELFEETGLSADQNSVMVLGKINPNSAFYKTSISVVAIRFNKLEEIANPGQNKDIERIRKIKPYTFEDIRKLNLECGLTQAALFEFGCFKPEFYQESLSSLKQDNIIQDVIRGFGNHKY